MKSIRPITFWNRIPILIRAIFLGLLIGIVGLNLITVLATMIPMPWAFLVTLILLIIYIQYFRGKGKPSKTQIFRKDHFRLIKLSRKTWILGIILAALFVILEQAFLVVTFRIIEFPAQNFSEEYAFLAQVPVWASWLYVAGIAIVAAVCEEVGFRGYMQVPLEKKYGPLIAICVVSIFFLLVHMHQAWSGPILIHIFLLSVVFGIMAYVTDSLIPGIIAHFVMDLCNFAFWWSPIGWQFDRQPIGITGVDIHFVIWTALLAVSLGLFLVFARNLWKGKLAV